MATAFRFEEMITCVICQEIYIDPVALSCLHTLCGKCISNLKRYPKKLHYIECPLCRDMTDIRAIKKDFRTKNLVDILVHQVQRSPEQSSSLCQLCQKRDIVCKCHQCDKLMCSDCRESHIAIPLCERHTIKPLDLLIHEGKLLVAELLDKLAEDKQVYENRLQQLSHFSDDLEQSKQLAKHDIDTSEQYFTELVKTYHQHLRTSIDHRVLDERKKIISQKADVVDGICKLESTALIVSELATKSDTSAVLASNLQLLSKVKLPELVLPDCDGDRSIGFLDIRIRPESEFKMCDAIDVIVRSSETRVDRSTEDLEQADQENNLPSAPCYEDLFPPLPDSSQPTGTHTGATRSATNNESLRIPRRSTSPGDFASTSAASSDRTAVNRLKYCDQVSLLVDEIQAKCAPSAPPESSLMRSSRSVDSLRDLGATADSAYSPHDVQPLYVLSDLKTKRLVKKRDIVLERFDTPLKLRLINQEIWCLYKDKIQMYELGTDNLLRVFRHKNLKNARSMCQAYNGDDFIVCDNAGLLVFGPTRLYQDTFPGSFSDVTSEGERIYALEQKKCCVMVFASQQGPSRLGQRSAVPHWHWKVLQIIQRTDSPSLDDTILTKGDTIYIGSYRGDSVLMFSHEGEPLGQLGRSGKGEGELWRPRLCCVDREGAVLVADFYNNRLQLLDRCHTWQSVDIQGLNFPWDAVLDVTCGLMVLQQCNINHKIIQFLGLAK